MDENENCVWANLTDEDMLDFANDPANQSEDSLLDSLRGI